MDQSFNDRVDKVFRSISSSSSTPWSLTDAQVERRVWNRHKADNKDDDDETLVSSSFDNLFNCRSNRRKSLDEDDEDVGGDDAVETENDGDEWDIRSSIGLDSTLDKEEEEDAYDKMAEGRENGDECERVYMKDVTDHGPYLNSHNVLPSLVHENHDAAKTRLKEEEDDDDDEPMLNAEEVEACVPAASGEWEGGYGMRIKSILKRKNNDDALKPTAKRVRFDPSCNKTDDRLRNGSQVQVQGFASPGNVPDYIVNPSKYTRYDFDEEGSNREAYLDIMESKHVGVEESLPTTSSSSVVFIPRKKKKRGDDDDGIGEAAAFNHVRAREEQAKAKRSSTAKGSIAIAALELEVQQQQQQKQGEGEAINQEMQEEEEESHVCSKKPGRRYRSRMEQQDDDDDNAS
ncbi:unnamed protein product [Lactuca virosa]|uniref:Protein TSSC4 n=1 Tax=Lactuca virosa TaxID=75947 RepID=A0AAU9LTV3_9ASTR|nr:unnamed protein product [Lactuca virosa]